MPWYVLAGLSVILYSVNGILHRVLMKKENSDPFAQSLLFTVLVTVFSYLIIIFTKGTPAAIAINQFPAFILIAALYCSGTYFGFLGYKHIEASEHTILLTSSKFWSIAGAVLILREAATFNKIFGGILVIIGVLIVEWRRHKFTFNRGALFVILAAASYSFAETLSFYSLRTFDGSSFIFYIGLLMVIIFLLMRPQSVRKLTFYRHPRNLANILVVSFNDTLGTLFLYFAYQSGHNALQIGPVMSTQTVVTAILAFFLLKERSRLPQKIAGAVFAMAGTYLIFING